MSYTNGSNGHIRASTAERERALDVLRAAYSEGRLDEAELRWRTEQASDARTLGELQELVFDLPVGPFPMQAPMQTPMQTSVQLPVAYPIVPPYGAPMRPTNGLATGALICGILGVFCLVTAIPAVVLGHVSLSQIRRTREGGRGMAVAGLTLGWIVILGFATLIATAIAVAGSQS